MQTLGLSDSTPRTQGRFKALFWPTIANDNDVDYLTRQGFWICIVVSALTLAVSIFLMAASSAWPALAAALLQVLFYFLCGVGIRVLNRTAAVAAFSAYFLNGLVITLHGQQGFSVVGIIILALLLANIRATFLAVRWVASRTEPPPVPLTRTFSERFSDVMPHKLWPVGRFAFYAVAVIESVLLLAALLLPSSRSR